jgi:Na+/H+ antiporter NhaD/arsenite permease-like protein
MEFQQVLALAVFAAVTLLFATRLVPKAVAGLVGALVVALWAGFPAVLGSQVPEALLVTAGLMVLSGSLKRSGLASWLTLLAVKASRGRPVRILWATGLLTFVLGAFVGPLAAVALVVPVALLLAVELDVPTLPFVLVLSWTSLLGSLTVLTAHPANLWTGAVLGIDGGAWLVRMVPLTLPALAVTLVLGSILFRKTLRATNERRARVLEFDEFRSLGNRAQVAKTVTVLVLVALGLGLAPVLGLSPALVVITGAVGLLLLEGPGAVDRSLSEIDGGLLLFYAGLFAVVGALAASGLPKWAEGSALASPLVLLWTSAVAGALVDHGAVIGAFLPFVKAAGPHWWPVLVVGATLGGAATVWGAVSNALALGFAPAEGKAAAWKGFTLWGLVFAAVNLTVVTVLILVLP